ncbi:molecular chaperone GrpE [Verrucomicrobium sp. GAS474]|uniref:nucleotide exchange factor GrpE n=1 Tax=Verrucomicrobium sp. GAS474 TaxID=1882831 RepID=UPI00087C2831|nr:nucleotide exchange factor GrpE [Verrucomicrobium sp. GAS474]SDU18639.1 molecular chaperone GrpE [Verrucomicrobium sp. GAS474]
MNQKHQQSPVPPGGPNTETSPSGDAVPDSLKEELAEQKDRYLRLAADFDNFRKRTAQEAERRSLAKEDALINEILPVIDNLERALAVGPDTSFVQLLEGVSMILQQFRQLLYRHDIEVDVSLGKPFDPLRHEAIGSRNVASQPDHAILEIVQQGYHRGDGILRAAKVIVNDHSQ